MLFGDQRPRERAWVAAEPRHQKIPYSCGPAGAIEDSVADKTGAAHLRPDSPHLVAQGSSSLTGRAAMTVAAAAANGDNQQSLVTP